jgi:signal transduction histidine kinase
MQVMANLISNAAKFSPPTGKVKISADRHSAGIRIGVRDYGNGIPPELQGCIFQKFFQADSSDARAKGGTGLGLSISKAIVEHMNGRIGFATTVGAGTLFYVDLPLWSESPAIAGDDHSQDFQEAAGIGEPQGNSHGA